PRKSWVGGVPTPKGVGEHLRTEVAPPDACRVARGFKDRTSDAIFTRGPQTAVLLRFISERPACWPLAAVFTSIEQSTGQSAPRIMDHRHYWRLTLSAGRQ